MSGVPARSCATCGVAKHCMICGDPDNPTRLYCPAWRPLPAPAEKKPVAGCEYCRPPAAPYQETYHTKLGLSTFGKARTLVTSCEPCPPHSRCGSRGRAFRAEFIINFCPNCGRDLRGD